MNPLMTSIWINMISFLQLHCLRTVLQLNGPDVAEVPSKCNRGFVGGKYPIYPTFVFGNVLVPSKPWQKSVGCWDMMWITSFWDKAKWQVEEVCYSTFGGMRHYEMFWGTLFAYSILNMISKQEFLDVVQFVLAKKKYMFLHWFPIEQNGTLRTLLWGFTTWMRKFEATSCRGRAWRNAIDVHRNTRIWGWFEVLHDGTLPFLLKRVFHVSLFFSMHRG